MADDPDVAAHPDAGTPGLEDHGTPDDGPAAPDAPDSPSDQGGGWSCATDDDCGDMAGSLGPCEQAGCIDGACSTLPAADGAACDDQDACTEGESCKSGQCGGGSLKACSDDDPCTHDTCDKAAGCQHSPAPGPCNDGDACTQAAARSH